MASIRVENVVKAFGKTIALRGVSLEINDKELFAILGPSGCGKTTLLRIIAGFEAPDSGRVFFGDRDVTFLEPSRRGAVMVFQNWALWPHMTVYDNIAYGLRIRKTPESEIRKRVKWALDLLGLSGTENRYPHQLSGGQQQRVALARALVVEPEVLLLDEPLSNLDAKLRLKLRGEIKKLQRKLGITTVYVTHDQEEALALADRVAVMRSGVIEQVGSPAELYRSPATLFTAVFLGKTSTAIGVVEDVEGEVAVVRIGELVVKAYRHGIQAGERGVVVFKSEAARWKRESPEDNVLRGIVTVSMYLGAQLELRISIPGSRYEVTAYLPADSKGLQPGSSVEVYFPLQSVHIYPVDEEILGEIEEKA